MGDYIAVIGIVVGVVCSLFGVMLSVIGYLVIARLKGIEKDTGCLPEIQTELAGMKVKVESLTEKQEDFCNQQEDQGNRLRGIETTINNTERVTVLEGDCHRHTEEINKLRPIVHELITQVQVVLTKVSAVEREIALLQKPALSGK